MDTVVDALASAIVAEGVTLVACVPDDVTIFIAEALRERGVRIVRPRHEQSAVVIADGYARATHAPSVCIVGPGPGIAQTGTGLVTAKRRRSPVLVVVAEPSSPVGEGKSLDIRRFVESVEAQYVSLRSPATLAEDVHEAFRRVRTRLGPVVLNVSDKGTLRASRPTGWHYVPTREVVLDGVDIDPSSPLIDRAAGMLATARTPVILAGGGVANAEAAREIAELADRVGALLATSMQSRGLFGEHPREIGIFGSLATESAVELVAEADCILALGASLNVHQTGGSELGSRAKLIQVDHEVTRIGRHATPEISIVADAGAAVRALNRALAKADITGQESRWTRPDVQARITAARNPEPPAPATAVEGTLALSAALRAIDAMLPENRVVVVDAGLCVPFVFDLITVPEPDAWVWSADFVSIGLGLGVGIGTALARPDRACAVFVGDGGLSMSLQELETVVRERIPLTIVVLNDNAYSAEVHALGDKPKDLALFAEVDFAAVFRALGGEALTFRRLDERDAVAELIARRDGPVLVDAKVTENEHHRLFVTH